MKSMLEELTRYLVGWKCYYGQIETSSVLKNLDGWIRRRIRCYQLHLWGRGSGIRKGLCGRGLTDQERYRIAWCSKGLWRMSVVKPVQIALSNAYLEQLGYVPLYRS
jgi:RNA-directed DNA polymerase